jgi:catechol 2,3-dioxygenase-like lactoylglutathione lyase family enzyme
MLTALDHVVIGVRDLERARESYMRLLGRQASWQGVHPQQGTANVLFRLDNTYIELLAATGAGVMADWLRQRLEETGEGLCALAFATADAAACATMLRARGLDPTAPVEGSGERDGDGDVEATRHWKTVLVPVSDTRGIPLFIIEHLSPADLLPLAQPTADVQAAVAALDHAVIFTSDPDGAQRLYADKLGLRLALDRTFEARRLRLQFFRVGGITVELAAPLGIPPGEAAVDRFYGLSYRVPNIAAAHDRLAGEGFDVSEVRPGMREGTRVCTIRNDTHGVATLMLGPEN